MKKEIANISKGILRLPKKNNYGLLDENEYIIKDIEPDCNWFYRSPSYYYRDKEDDYNEFRQLIYAYIEIYWKLYWRLLWFHFSRKSFYI